MEVTLKGQFLTKMLLKKSLILFLKEPLTGSDYDGLSHIY